MSSSTSPRIENPDHLQRLLALSRVLHEDIPLRVTIAPSTTPVISLSAIKHSDYLSLPVTGTYREEWNERYYATKEPACSLWVCLYHLIAFRGQQRLLGHFHVDRPLIERVAALLKKYKTGAPVTLFLSCLYVADEFRSDCEETTLSEALEVLRTFADHEVARLQSAAEREPLPPVVSLKEEGGAAGEVVRIPGNAARVAEHRLGVYTTVWEIPPQDIRSRDTLLHLLQRVSLSLSGRGLDGNVPHLSQVSQYADAYISGLSVSLLHSVIAQSREDRKALHYYRALASVSWQTVWRRAARCLSELGVPTYQYLRFVHDYLGRDAAAILAAVGEGGPQHGVTDISYSMFAERGGGDKVSLAIPAGLLMDVGRLACDENVVRPPAILPPGDTKLVVKDTSGKFITVHGNVGQVILGRIDSSVRIC